MTKCTTQEAIGNTCSTLRDIETVFVQGAVLNVTLFLVAMADISREIEGPSMTTYENGFTISSKITKSA
jgi:hypothetical protein